MLHLVGFEVLKSIFRPGGVQLVCLKGYHFVQIPLMQCSLIEVNTLRHVEIANDSKKIY